jgi:hypothetical protein
MKNHEARLRRLEEELDPEEAWLRGCGLAALLAYAKHHPRAPWEAEADEEEDEAPVWGMRRLLHEARQWQQEHGHER